MLLLFFSFHSLSSVCFPPPPIFVVCVYVCVCVFFSEPIREQIEASMVPSIADAMFEFHRFLAPVYVMPISARFSGPIVQSLAGNDQIAHFPDSDVPYS